MTSLKAGFTAAGYYLAHGTLATALLFLVGERIAYARGDHADELRPGPVIRGRFGLPAAFLLAAVAVAGLPPLGGFLAKLAILDAALPTGGAAWTLAVVLFAVMVGGYFLMYASAHPVDGYLLKLWGEASTRTLSAEGELV